MKLEVNGTLNFKCPICHKDDPVIAQLSKAEVTRGMLLETDTPGSKNSRMVLVNDDKLKAASQGDANVAKELSGKMVKMLFTHWDYCGNCGNEYIRSVSLKEIKLPDYVEVHRSGEKKLILPGFVPPRDIGNARAS